MFPVTLIQIDKVTLIQINVTFNTAFWHLCVSGNSEVTSVNNFPVCGLFAFFLRVPTETIICRFGVKSQDLPLLMDPERESGHRCSYEDSVIRSRQSLLHNRYTRPMESCMSMCHGGMYCVQSPFWSFKLNYLIWVHARLKTL